MLHVSDVGDFRDANGEGVPCRTDRLDAVGNMLEYLRLHDYTITNEGDM